MKQELVKLKKQIRKLLDRILNTESERLITSYEDCLTKLESQKLELTEKCSSNGESKAPFEELFERAMLFLANPQKTWTNGTFADKRTVLKLAFLGNLAFTRGKGFRTPKTFIPFMVLEDISNAKRIWCRLEDSNLWPYHYEFIGSVYIYPYFTQA